MTSIEPEVETEPISRQVRPCCGGRDVLLALSIAHLAFVQSWYGLLFERSFSYFNRVPVNRVSLAALLINICALAAALWLSSRVVQRVNRRWLWVLANLALCAALVVPLNFLRTYYFNFTGGKVFDLIKHPGLIALAVLVGIGSLWLHRYAAKVATGIFIILSPMLLFTAGKSAWWMIRPPPAARDNLATPTTTKPGSPRVVWLLLDELDQRIAFEHQKSLPELARIYNECLRATNAFPPGGSTRYSVPALTLGREVRGARPTAAGELSFNGNARWSESETVFSRARALGFSTAAVGWYHPYGRVLGGQLERCEWYSYPPFEEERGQTLHEALVNQVCSIFSQFQQRRLHIQNFKASQAAALNFLTNAPANLTLLHLPAPHTPGIYNPKRQQFTAWKYSQSGEYLDNLILADRLFGSLRRAMEQNGTWESAWLVLSSDHWWREASDYDGKIDHRVPFILKAPGQNESVTYSKKLDTVLTYHLILSILKGDLTSAAELPQWLDAFRTEPPSAYGPTGEPR